ncbi:hypothetical protein RRG08_006952 [Elysia crispata]|uniref:Uncharacterized protein n=1 Tax=Elysia crispata TaxID=231223 RepID=A0AAE0XR28_9GAST|nr:hypothetical protein RRG08_006952 [Elysia crispata]
MLGVSWAEVEGRERTEFGFVSQRATNYRARIGLQSWGENQDGKFERQKSQESPALVNHDDKSREMIIKRFSRLALTELRASALQAPAPGGGREYPEIGPVLTNFLQTVHEKYTCSQVRPVIRGIDQHAKFLLALLIGEWICLPICYL